MRKIQFLVSTKAESVTNKVNEWLKDNSDVIILKIEPFMSYTSIKDKGAMMIGCMIEYATLEDSSMENEYKEVRFDMFCNKCINQDKDENMSPCDICLSKPMRKNSHKPTNFIPKED